jgi:hypothetical protein
MLFILHSLQIKARKPSNKACRCLAHDAGSPSHITALLPLFTDLSIAQSILIDTP